MASRLTDSDKWKTRFIRKLKPTYKLLWVYMLDDCNNAGIWEKDFETAKFRLGFDVNEKEAKEQFGNEIEEIMNGERWFIPSFIEFQYGHILNPKNKAHLGALRLLYKNKVDCDDYLFGKELPWAVLDDKG